MNLSYLSNPIKKISFHRHFNICRYQIDAMKHQHKNKLNAKGASHIDFVHEKRYMDVGNGGGGGGGTFLSQKSWKFSIVSVFIVYLYAHYQVLALPQVYFYTFIYQTQS